MCGWTDSLVVVLAVLCAAASCARSVKEPAAGDAGTTAGDGSSGALGAHAPRPVDGGGASDAEALVFNLAPLPPDAPFQGMVSLQAKFGNAYDAAPAYVFTLKEKKARWDLIGQGGKGEVRGYRVYDGDEHRFYTVAPELKSVLVTDEAVLATDAGGASRTWTWKPFTAEPHGVVGGRPCDRMITRDDELEYDVCAAPGLAPFPMQDLSGAIASVVPFNASLMSQGMFPLHVTVRRLHAGDGGVARGVVGSLQVMRIERGRVPLNAFDLPPSLPRVPTASLDFGRPPRR